MEAPEKLYLHPTDKGKVGASWLTFPLTNEDIEYTRTDAFIEKACEWFLNNVATYFGYNCVYPSDLAKDFRKAMKGE